MPKDYTAQGTCRQRACNRIPASKLKIKCMYVCMYVCRACVFYHCLNAFLLAICVACSARQEHICMYVRVYVCVYLHITMLKCSSTHNLLYTFDQTRHENVYVRVKMCVCACLCCNYVVVYVLPSRL